MFRKSAELAKSQHVMNTGMKSARLQMRQGDETEHHPGGEGLLWV